MIKKDLNMRKKITLYTIITAIVTLVMFSGCASLSQYFKGWTITIKPATESSVSAQTGSADTTSPVYKSVSSDSTQFSGAH